MTSVAAGVSPLLDHDPAEIGPFRLIGRLGAGGMGVVYAGLSPVGERVAVKVVHAELAHDPEFRARFAREIALLEKVRSACTVTVLSANAEAARPWLATEYVPGPTLEAHVRTAGPLAGDELYGLASGLAEALVSMHAAGVVHRDLKPANVILSPSGPRVVDLGIARAIDETSVTRTGVLIGSPAWLSPEHYREDEVGPATDVHAWGLLVAFAATGRLPFGSGRPEVLAVRVLQDAVDLTGVDPELRATTAAALAKAPEDRPSAPEILASVTEAWRRRTDTELGDVPEGDAATALIQRTWVMPSIEDSAWTLLSPRGVFPSKKTPLRRLTPGLVGLGVAALAAVTAVLALSPTARSNQASQNSVAPNTSASSSAGNAVSPGVSHMVPSSGHSGETATPPHGSRASLDSGVSALVPTGWSVKSGMDTIGQYICLLAPDRTGDNCMTSGVLIENWAGTEDQPDLEAPDAWAGASDESGLPQCFDPKNPNAVGITSAAVSSSGLRKLGSRSAIFHQYHVACGPRVTFNPRIWWLPRTRLMMTIVTLPDRYLETVDEIAASIRFN
jgi:serine/threonine protein kinase